MNRIAQILRRRGVARTAYLHADHFEPWRKGIVAQHCEEIEAFTAQTQQAEWSRKLTLFYRAHIPYGLAGPNKKLGPGDLRLDDDVIYFRERTPQERRMASGAIGKMLRRTSHEVQVHVHHEGYTLSSKLAPRVSEVLVGNTNTEREAARLELGLRLALEAIREETGEALVRWAFVHGNWALNASDPEICRIENEIEILQRNGCIGDFTFPAGRTRCNPTLVMQPFGCRARAGEKAYDTESALPRPVARGSGLLENGRFFIWNSPVLHPFASIDYYARSSQPVFGDPLATAEMWVRQSPLIAETLYIKTHAHSMAKGYWEGVSKPVIPHKFDPVQRIFDHLLEGCSHAQVPFVPMTAGQVYDELRRVDSAGADIALGAC